MQTILANGLRFALFEEGRGPLVLLLHGFPDTAHTWDAVRPAVAAAGYRAVAPFLRGYAPTQLPVTEAFDGDTLGADVLALIQALGEKRAILVGHDFGAGAAYSAASLGPDQVTLLVTVAIPHPASLIPTPRTLWLGRHFFSLRLPNAAQRVSRNDFAHVDELVQRWSPEWNVPPGETAAIKAAMREPGCLEATLGYYRAIGLRPLPSQRCRIKVPTVCFCGASDLLRPSAFDRAAKWFTGGYRVVRMQGGHFMHREHPAQFIAQLLATLSAGR